MQLDCAIAFFKMKSRISIQHSAALHIATVTVTFNFVPILWWKMGVVSDVAGVVAGATSGVSPALILVTIAPLIFSLSAAPSIGYTSGWGQRGCMQCSKLHDLL
jgi:hypothetical protein